VSYELIARLALIKALESKGMLRVGTYEPDQVRCQTLLNRYLCAIVSFDKRSFAHAEVTSVGCRNNQWSAHVHVFSARGLFREFSMLVAGDVPPAVTP